MIWDLHCHLNGVPGRTPDEQMARLIECADRMQIERLILFMGSPFLLDPTLEQFRQQNDQVLQAISHWHHRAFGFADPTAGIVEMAVRELGAERVLYGSDVAGRSFSSQLAKVTSAEIEPHGKQMIPGQNLRRLMTPILQAREVRL